MTDDADGPLAGLTVVEVAVGVSDLGLGLAGGVPGMMLADLGAAVTRVVGSSTPGIDAGVPWGRVWHRRKQVVVTDDPEQIATLVAGADVALVYGPEDRVEARGLGAADLRRDRPDLVVVRCRPSRTADGALSDWSLLLEARTGYCTQLAGHRPGPIFLDTRAPGLGAALVMAVGALGLLVRRQRTGVGGWVETSLYDGLLATLGVLLGRSEHAAPEIESYWEHGSTFPNFLYRAADDELVQVWFGGKGMYAALLEVLGDEPSEAGYYADQVAGMLNERARRWTELFARRDRKHWIEHLRAAGVACEPVLGPGDALAEDHLAEIGLAVPAPDAGHDDVVLATPVEVRSFPGPAPSGPGPLAEPGPRLLEGLKVLDCSAFVAGPLGAQVLADLGAEVIKVEPLEGEAMRAAAYAVAACQRGKRSLAIDLQAPAARPVVERLIRWSDVVLHNFRVGVAERLGIDAATVAAINPGAVHCHASAFGSTGPRATFPGNDALMQALTGLEVAVGGAGNDPIAPTWIPIDVTGGWVAAIGMLAGLLARLDRDRGQEVLTSLLGAGMLVQSGTFRRDDRTVAGPTLDADQTGYGPGYRLYRAGDGAWLALVVPDADAWARLRALPGLDALPTAYVPLRTGPDGTALADAPVAERVLETVFASAPAAEWIARLAGAGIPVEAVAERTRDEFRRAVLDDPLDRALGRVVAYPAFDWGTLEQVGPLVRTGPDAVAGTTLALPGIGEQSVAVLDELGFTPAEIDTLVADGVVRG